MEIGKQYQSKPLFRNANYFSKFVLLLLGLSKILKPIKLVLWIQHLFYVSSLSIRILEPLSPYILLSRQSAYTLSGPCAIQFSKVLFTLKHQFLICVCAHVVHMSTPLRMSKPVSHLLPINHTMAFKQKFAYSFRGFIIPLNPVYVSQIRSPFTKLKMIDNSFMCLPCLKILLFKQQLESEVKDPILIL